jgi:hypothetical protein
LQKSNDKKETKPVDMKYLRIFAIVFLALTLPAQLIAQKPLNELIWSTVATKMPDN